MRGLKGVGAFCWFGVAALLLLLGCGGGGGPGGSSGGSGGQIATPPPGQYMEFLRSNGTWFDPFNLKVGDAGRAVLANYDALGTRTVLVAGNWNTTVGLAFVNIDASTGVFTVVQSPIGPFKFRTTSTIGGNPTLFEQGARIPIATAKITGKVVELGLFTGLPTSVGVPHIGVDFFDSSGALVGSARTMPNGTFSSTVPTTATLMMLQSDTIITSKYFKSVYWQGVHYSPLDTACRIQVGPIGGGTNPLPSAPGLPQAAGGPPPPPGGCS